MTLYRLLAFLLLFLQLHFQGILCDDKDALLSFKSQVTDPKNSLSGWNSNSSICSWYGLSCTRNTNRVQSLSLPGLGLSGNLPSSLSNLTHLQSLDLSSNAFQGRLPLELSNLSLLNTINLAANNLIGTLPWQLSLLNQLQVLDFSSNNFTGQIPPEFGNFSSLKNLSLARNHLSGEIPSDLGNLRNLSHLQLSQNYFSGDFPITIFNISSLTFLSVTQNHFSGKLPQDIGDSLPNLRSLYLADNMFGGVIPDSISNASHIQDLDLSHNQFHGYLPLFSNMRNLTWLILSNNHLSSRTSNNSDFFDYLIHSPKLKILMIDSNQLAGELPRSIANLSTTLEQFCVSNNFFSGSIPQGIGKFQNLVSLSFENNHFTGEKPRDIGALNKLVQLLAYKNKFSGEIPDMFGNFTQLSMLALHNNKLFGRIPSSIGQCERLNYLNLQMNNLHGTIPEGIFRLSSLTTLSLAGNTLHGFLPSKVSSMEQLQFLDMSNNLMTGYIPEEIDGCTSLRMLQLARNKFSGPVPSTLGNLTSLETLDLSSNNLSGPIPSTLEKLRYMVKLNLSFNHLEGEVPVEGVFTNLTQVTLLENSNLCSPNKEVAERLRIIACVKGKRHRFLLPLILAVTVASIFCISICLVWVKWFRKKEKKNDKTSLSISPLKGAPQNISFSDIRAATKNFASENLIGNGGFGFVYKGVFSIDQCETTLAVKVLDLKQSKASQSFSAECEALKNVRHRNLVKLVTSCSSIDYKGDDFKALVMQFMTNGNLDTWLYPVDEESGSSLSFLQRLNIAIDIANAMDYLHHDCNPPVVHCDLKPGNVLLDENMVGHVGDFGLARLLSQDLLESVTLGLKGTIGYIPPEYGLGGKASTLGDVYSFGILLLEMFIAKKPTDEMFKEGLSLEKFASAMDENQLVNAVDPKPFNDFEWSTQSSSTGYPSEGTSDNFNSGLTLRQSKSEECAAAVIRTGLSCAAEVATNRLTMRQASKQLQGIRQTLLAI
ncbi:putative receptor-like protein kinase At3g47110 [Prosopis cineraria]|uniref:putative receptor-like protein kinase At3g47110 n=1 Tax=Prosopis cineraria TaxID=364024 RepID=UPI00240F57AA|nr:putative receptor-like protein kinase At3g47110 [Prosopis cineraria]